jgi:ribonuclease D
VLSNQAMLELAARAPRTPADLRQVQGISSGLADRRGRDILAAVRRGLEIPEADLPRFPASRRWERDPEMEERAEALRQVRTRVAEELDLDAGFLMSRALLEEIARTRPTTPEELKQVPDVRNWQVEALGDRILASLRR